MTTKEGLVLKNYRGSTSLESFHLHLNRFISGEPIRIDYLYRQTGQVLQDMNPDSEETDELLEDLNIGEEQEDEGFEDQDLDLTVGNLMTSTSVPGQPANTSTQSAAFSAATLPTSASTQSAAFSAATLPTSASTQSAAFSASTLPTSASTQSAAFSASIKPVDLSVKPAGATPDIHAVDEHNMPGMDRVDTLAEYLVSLRNHTGLTLSNQQVSTIIGLWQNLLPFDQQRVVFAARHQDRLITGKFRSPKKKAEFTAGVESLKRCVLGSTASPAQWPDCCCSVETISVRLCRLRVPKSKDSVGA
ncbi:uncharacterized protein LOC123976040 [Micropterus dolomieu]|uniref:uncharacterized protein LOC123976040 n=1 Tax=Micropterus dolomieu TaxID=147949 RepID=UPI001E8DD227|nr:uncharacterized protein LOC123976040 [Micropterus dolomieu]